MTETRKLVRTTERGIYKRMTGDKVTGYCVLFRQGGKQRKRYVPTLAAARAEHSKVHAALDAGEYQPRSTVKLTAYLADWVKAYRGTGRRGFRENTRTEYERLLDSYALRFFPERLRLVDVQPQHIAAFVTWLADPAEQAKTLAPASIRNALIPVRAAMSDARRRGLIRHNPCDGAVIPHVDVIAEDDDENTKALSRDELRLVLGLAHGRDHLLIETLASTGLRISELIGLQIKDLHLDGERPHLTVRRAIVRGKVSAPKTRHGRRTVPLPQPLVHRLREHVADLPDTPEAPVFASGSGGPLLTDNLRRRMLAPLLAEAGVSWASFHTLRHTFASLQIAAGANIVALSRALGHHSASFTLDVYSHLLEGDQVGALDLGEVLATPATPADESSFVGASVGHDDPR